MMRQAKASVIAFLVEQVRNLPPGPRAAAFAVLLGVAVARLCR